MREPFFRWHRGGFKESLDTAVHYKTADELKMIISQAVEIKDDTKLKTKYMGVDSRVGYLHTHMVLVNDQPIGFVTTADTEYENTNPLSPVMYTEDE